MSFGVDSTNCRRYAKGEQVYTDCLWVCYNKLDRRFREYWQEHKDKMTSRYYGDQ